MGFIATRSGLMRFSDHMHLFVDPEEEMKKKRRKQQAAPEEQEEPEIKEP